MIESPIVSVVLPVYNAKDFLEETIVSILTQRYTNLELIIINDGSTDNSLDIINKYKESDYRIVLVNRENRGFVYSLNEAISLSKGKYIARMDADDISLKDRFEEQIKILDNMKNIDVVGCNYQLIDNKSNITGEVKVPISESDILMALCYSVPFAHPSVMIRKSIFENIKYEENPTEDYLLWSKIYKNNNFHNIDKLLFQYRHQYGSSFSDTKRVEMMKSEKEIAKLYFKKNRKYILANLINFKVENNIYFNRALVSIYIHSSKIDALKTLLKYPNNIFSFLKYYFRHLVRMIYWNIKNI